ncbi:hypothetical protein GIB67_035712 [Kingdonia uniflora]|uniref:Uncharacterized protein n=1 Tax=Kingdonia uniflora TaxID=39325 RepID=A0A7J7M5J0_9MAGN|nr:hypothetical protein GIB67_035712 [Kingdonia uniflora]
MADQTSDGSRHGRKNRFGGQEQADEEILKDVIAPGDWGLQVNPDEVENAHDDPLHTSEGVWDEDVEMSQANIKEKSIKPSDAELEDMQIQFTIRINDLHRHLDNKLPDVLYD